MSLCCNCTNDGVWRLDDGRANGLDYCRECLPNHLLVRANSGHFPPSHPEHPPHPPKRPTPRKKP